MSREVQIRSSMVIKSGELEYSSQPTAFQADMAGSKGPCPGAFLASTAGTDVDLTELTTPGLCRIVNLDPTNFVRVGIWDPDTSTFYPMSRLLAGESYVMRLDADIEEEYGTGTGTIGANTNRLRVKADTAACNVSVEAFEV